jgi:hypothetical protein
MRWGWRMLVKAMRGKNNIRTILDIIRHQCSEGNITLEVFQYARSLDMIKI